MNNTKQNNNKPYYNQNKNYKPNNNYNNYNKHNNWKDNDSHSDISVDDNTNINVKNVVLDYLYNKIEVGDHKYVLIKNIGDVYELKNNRKSMIFIISP